MSWLSDRFATFDTETTGVDTNMDRIVTANVLTVGVAGVESELSWLLDPGIPIPAEASAIHGITTERAQAEGKTPALTVPLIAAELRRHWDAGMPVVAFNASFDFSIVDAELRRLGLPGLGQLGPVLDPLVIDRACDKWRKGERKLGPMAAHYGVKQDTAHDSRGDALTAARILWVQSRKYSSIIGGLSLDQMQRWQRDQHVIWAEGFEAYRAKKGQPVTIERSWPMRTEVRP